MQLGYSHKLPADCTVVVKVEWQHTVHLEADHAATTLGFVGGLYQNKSRTRH